MLVSLLDRRLEPLLELSQLLLVLVDGLLREQDLSQEDMLLDLLLLLETVLHLIHEVLETLHLNLVHTLLVQLLSIVLYLLIQLRYLIY